MTLRAWVRPSLPWVALLLMTGCNGSSGESRTSGPHAMGDTALLHEVQTLCPSCAPLLRMATDRPAESADFADAAFVLGGDHGSPAPGHEVVAKLPRSSDGILHLYAEGLPGAVDVRRTGISRSVGVERSGTVEYRGNGEEADALVFEAAGAIEELLVVRRSGARLAYELELPQGASLRSVNPSTVEVDRGGAAWLRLSADRAWDADGKRFHPTLQLQGKRVALTFPAEARLPVVVDPTWENARRMQQARLRHGAVLLPSGKVLVAGGCTEFECEGDGPTATAEIYDPLIGTYSNTGAMTRPRHSFTMTALASGQVLVVGGCQDKTCDKAEGSAELYDPATGEFTLLPAQMSSARWAHTATRLPSGQVLVAGGSESSASGSELPTAELFDPAGAGTFTQVSSMSVARASHTATLLRNGKVLIAGGLSQGVSSKAAELFDPTTQSFALTGNMGTARAWHTSTGLANGEVLLFGGCTYFDCSSSLASAEKFDPTGGGGAGVFKPIAATAQMARRMHGAALLPTGKVLIVAGCVKSLPCWSSSLTRTAELFDPVTETFQATIQPDGMRRDFTATMLSSGRVLMAGGSGGGMALKASEMFDPVGLDTTVTEPASATPPGSISLSKVSMAKSRLGQTATLLQNGKVLLVGGIPCTDAANPLVCGLPISPAESYDFQTDTIASGGSLKVPRLAHRSLLLNDGKVLVAGGCDNGACQAVYGFSGALDALEVYDPATGAFTLSPSKMSETRVNETLTLLADGRVLIAGGCTMLTCAEGGTEFRTSVDLYDPSTGEVLKNAAQLARARAFHTATVLESGKVLIVGGRDGNGSVDLSEIFDPQTMKLTQADSTIVPRTAQAAVLMPTGAVLLAGGLGASGLSSFTKTAEYYQPFGTSSLIPPMKEEHFWPNPPGAVQLLTGKIALFGGWAVTTNSGVDASPLDPDKKRAAEVFDPLASMGVGAFAYAGMMQEARTVHSVTRLPSGKVLLASGCVPEDLTGVCHNNVVSSTLELYHDGLVADGAWRPTVVAPSAAIPTGSSIQLSGTGFTGIPGGGSGTSSDSESGHPVALWLADSGGYPLTGEVTAWSDNALTWKAPMTARLGPGWLHIVVQGTASLGVPVRLSPAALAAPCDSGMQCVTGFCADGVCCDAACDQACMACTTLKKGSGQDGACKPVADSTDPDSDCEQQQFSTCGNDGECDGNGGCRTYKSGLQCSTPSCVLGNLTPAAACNGTGTCVAGAVSSCFPFTCNPDEKSCATTCSLPSECAAGAVCVKAACMAPVDNGAPCLAPEACKSGQCVDGVCCDAAACFPFTCGGTGCRKDCTDNSGCASGARCDVPSKTCVAGAACVDTTTAVDSQGKSVVCTPYLCKAGQCATRCTVSADCVAGFTCDRASGSCVQPEQPVAQDQGCGCSVPGMDRRSGGAAALAAALSLALLRTRRRRRFILPMAVILLATPTARAAEPPAPAASSSQAQPAPAAAAGSASAPTAEVEAAKDKAKARFVRGLELVQNEVWDAALAEFLASREIFPTRVAVKNAAMCLRQLNRTTEALAMYQELVQRYGSNLSAEERRTVDEAIAQLRERVGEIVVTTNIQGATVIVGGKQRGVSPISEPMVVDAGTHTVRVFKEGYLPFEAQVAVAGKQRKSVMATMQALASSGTLAVAEAQARAYLVVVDGVEMGKTPWTGTLALGSHVVLLRGDDAMGTPPSAATVTSNQTTRLTLHAVRLDAELRVEPTPSNARVDIDGVTVGNGVWEGRLGSGLHRVEVSSEGFLAWRKDLSLNARRDVQRVVLERDLTDPRWREAFHGYPYLEAMIGGAWAPSFGGSMDSACSKGDCSERTRPWGFMFGARAGYQVASAVGVELMLGYLRLSGQATRKASATADFPTASLDAHDTTLLTGAMIAASASLRPLRKQPLLARLSVGVVRARATFTNEGTFTGGSPTAIAFSLSVPESGDNFWVPMVGPEVRYGYRVSRSLVVDFGIAFLLMFPPETLRRGLTPRDLERGVRSQVVPDVTLPDGTLVRPGTAVLDREHGFGTFLCILPTLGGRWDL